MSHINAEDSSAVEQPDQLSSTCPNTSEKLKALPAPIENSEIKKLDMSTGNASVMLDHLGPVVVGLDGSLGRISNFEKMTETEKKNTLRIISKRNKERLEALRSQKDEQMKSP
ncbi:hypothetical protein GcM1_124007 [Golovinomyces cichoracearum]|uniref:Uncharacterized protein n=1 Tax=Golovinomyces cichoracearum TaxID=62708 RepID=A0A420JC01_9PEZI|nr:hypothetical protein GcM1_124007 [Golovinomyces cichoracearum]